GPGALGQARPSSRPPVRRATATIPSTTPGGGVMPRSRSRPRRSPQRPPSRKKPRSSPRRVPAAGIGLILAGVAMVVLTYLLRLPGGGYSLVLGLALMGGGLVALSRYR